MIGPEWLPTCIAKFPCPSVFVEPICDPGPPFGLILNAVTVAPAKGPLVTVPVSVSVLVGVEDEEDDDDDDDVPSPPPPPQLLRRTEAENIAPKNLPHTRTSFIILEPPLSF
jgi:hypothetical protein